MKMFFLLTLCLTSLVAFDVQAARYTTQGASSQNAPPVTTQRSNRMPSNNRSNSVVMLPEKEEPICTKQDLDFISEFDVKAQKNIAAQTEINQTVGDFDQEENEEEFRDMVSETYGFMNTEEYKVASVIYARCNREIPKGKLDPHGITFWMPTDSPF